MALPFATTTVTITREGSGDALDRAASSAVASGVRAVIGSVSGSEAVTAGSSEVATAKLTCDPCPLTHRDRVTDDQTGDVWEVTYARRRIGFGLDHMTAGLVAVTGRAAIQ